MKKVVLNFDVFAERVLSSKQYDPKKANIIKKPGESKADYLARQNDLDLLSFILKAETPDEIREGMPLYRADGQIIGRRKIQPEDIARLYKEVPDLLQEVGRSTILDRDLITALNNFKEKTSGEEFYLF